MAALSMHETKLLEEMYIALQLVLVLVLLNVAFPMFSMGGLNMMSLFATLYTIFVAIKISGYIKRNIFRNEELPACPSRLATALDGFFLSWLVYIQWNSGHNLFSVFYLYVLIQGIRYQGRKPWVFALYPAMYYIFVHLFLEQRSAWTTMEIIFDIGMLFVITWFIEIPFRQIKEIHLERQYYYESLQEKNKELERMATTDYLTDLSNHQSFYTYFDNLKFHAIKNDFPISLTLIDIDNFKAINDTYGHLTGDQVLKELACLIQKSIRKTDFAARYGGEEFALIFPHTTLEEAVLISEKIRKAVENYTFEIDKKSIQVTVSMGTNTFSPHITYASLYDFINDVDKLLYKAKRNGKNQVQYFKSPA